MKKLFTFFAMSALALTITACGGNSGNKNTSTEATVTETTTETNAAAEATATEGDVIAKYEKLVDKAIELQGKVAGGDAAVVEEYTKLSQEMQAVATELSQQAATMTAEQAERFAAIQQKLVNAATAAAQ